MAKVAAPPHTYGPHEKGCPFSDEGVARSFDATLAEARHFSTGVLKFLETRPEESQAKWAQASVEAGRVLFQPWAMEILFVLAVARHARFGQLQHLLGGISSRTLSDKLQTLREEGFIDRVVHDEQPVRIEYSLTKEGRMAAALATPLFAHLNHRKME